MALSQPSSNYFSGAKPTLAKAVTPVEPAPSAPAPSFSRRNITPRATLASYSLQNPTVTSVPSSGSAFETYTLASSSQAPATERTEAQQKRHAAWVRRLQAPGGLISRRKSLALDEAAAAEARRAAGIEDDDEAIEMDSEDEKNKKKAEGVGSSLSAKFGAKDSKARGKVKKKEEVGPSGQTYTPLEKQFIDIKGENPDVLLLMEGKLMVSSELTIQSDTSSSFMVTMPRLPPGSSASLRG